MSKALRVLDYIFVLRPMLFYPGWSTLLAGYLIAYRGEWWLEPRSFMALDYNTIGLLLLAFAMAMGGSFLLNQLADVASDRKNQKLFLISEDHIPRNHALVESVILILFCLYLSYRLEPILALVAAVFCFVTGYMYNFSPCRLKDRPWGGLWANMAMGFLAFAFGWLGKFHTGFFPLLLDSLPYLWLNTSLYLFTTFPDVEGDRASGKHTLAVVYEIKPLIWVAFMLFLFSLASAVINGDRLALSMDLPLIPFFIYTLIRPVVETTVLTTKFAIFFFAMAVCLRIPFYFLLMFFGYFGTRWYFIHRFGLNYPNFRGKV